MGVRQLLPEESLDAKLKVGEGFVLNPSQARAWIRGTALPATSPLDEVYRPLDEQYRCYCLQIPPAARYRLQQQVDYVRQHAARSRRWVLPDSEPLPEESVPAHVVHGISNPENRTGVPAPLWTMLMFERREEA